MRAATGPGFVISVRISQWKESDYDAKIVEKPDELGDLVTMLRAAGADIFHVSARRFWKPEWDGPPISASRAGRSRSPTRRSWPSASVGLDKDVIGLAERRGGGADRGPAAPTS